MNHRGPVILDDLDDGVGEAAETSLGAQITNRICTHGPVSFIRKLEQVANANRRPGE